VEAPAMRKPRVRFREFLLVITLASLVVAVFAIRAKNAHRDLASDHEVHAYQARGTVDYLKNLIKMREKRLKMATTAGDKIVLQSDLMSVRAMLAKSVRDAEHHERLVRYYDPFRRLSRFPNHYKAEDFDLTQEEFHGNGEKRERSVGPD
jgi:hypothetical protein